MKRINTKTTEKLRLLPYYKPAFDEVELGEGAKNA